MCVNTMKREKIKKKHFIVFYLYQKQALILKINTNRRRKMKNEPYPRSSLSQFYIISKL